MELPDLTNLSLVQIVSTLLFFAAVDTIFAFVVALTSGPFPGTFNAAYALDFLRTHVLKIGVPILGLAIVGNGIDGYVPAIPACTVMAIGALGLYILATVASLRDTWGDKAVTPTSTTAIAPVQEQ